ncbi:MAG: prolipoprotein diacylglyceryl transferase [Puniceicoccales bacterium]|jgi:protein-S-isoprenylcysteine O-methyltransferase Ste14|nr:prolipoprotein diacylglyceryl transferase [Puniceicoccales bacterium]
MLGKFLYAFVFCVILPLGLGIWAVALDKKFPDLPVIPLPLAGWILVIIGVGLMLCGMWNLWHKGGGLPMNAFPPPKFVSTGIYRWIAHPIYVGFGLLVPGVAIGCRVPAGLWIITPVVWLGTVALVVGYERIDLIRRFGKRQSTSFFWLVPKDELRASFWEKLSGAFMAFVPWLVIYQGIRLLGITGFAVDTRFPFERNWPVWEWAGWLYLGAYLWIPLSPWLTRSRRELHDWVRDSWWGTGFIGWCFLVFPFVAPVREFTAQSWMGEMILLDQANDTIACAFPSFHVMWAFLAARLWKNLLGKTCAYAVAAAIAASCVMVGSHSVVDVLAGWLVFLGAIHCEAIWRWMLRKTESVANSWKHWRLGPVRIIIHGAYAGLSAAVGLLVIGWLLGPSHTGTIIVVTLCTLLGAGIWGQWLEASSMLSRPFGYFGSLFGGLAGVLLAQLLWGEGWFMIAAFTVASPLIQGIGRLRCLVQGCCHGRPTPPQALGIHYHKPLSRVLKIAKLGGVSIYPTPLYSILSNIVIFGLLVRLWVEGVDCAFISGTYLLLSTCARFMEEGYRGEPQTARWGGLAIYQWLALGCLLVGMVMTACPSPSVPAWTGFSFTPLLYAIPLGLLTWFLMGVDFPESSRRMSRLA